MCTVRQKDPQVVEKCVETVVRERVSGAVTL